MTPPPKMAHHGADMLPAPGGGESRPGRFAPPGPKGIDASQQSITQISVSTHITYIIYIAILTLFMLFTQYCYVNLDFPDNPYLHRLAVIHGQSTLEGRAGDRAQAGAGHYDSTILGQSKFRHWHPRHACRTGRFRVGIRLRGDTRRANRRAQRAFETARTESCALARGRCWCASMMQRIHPGSYGGRWSGRVKAPARALCGRRRRSERHPRRR